MKRHSTPLAVRLLTAPAIAAIVTAGLWVAGGLVTNDFALAMWLTVAWMATAGLGVLVLATRSPGFRLPALAGYAVVALAATAYLASSIVLDTRVDEDVATAAPRSAGSEARRGGSRPVRASASRGSENVALRTGRFEPVRHGATGEATLIRLAGAGGRVVTLTDFEVDNGPDLRVYLVAGPATTESEVTDYVDLGALKGNIGDQQYEIPAGVDLARYWTVVVWCRAFTVLFARAPTTS